LKKVTVHAAHDHGIIEITPELAEKVKAAIKSR
jgi:predicted small metal-binding protein